MIIKFYVSYNQFNPYFDINSNLKADIIFYLGVSL